MIRLIHEQSGWDELAGDQFADDVYYRWEFLEAWAKEERAEPTGFYFEHEETRIVYPFLKVSLQALPGGEGRFDVRTPYDFGGPRIVGPAEPDALERFDAAWRQYCLDTRVVTEFARLHPLAAIARTEDVVHHADNYVVDLRLSEEELSHRQHKNHRWAVRRAIRHQLAFGIESRPSLTNAASWKKMYATTMQRVDAGAIYDFSSPLFDALFDLPEVHLATVTAEDKPIAQALILASGANLFYYLSASSELGRSMKAANFLLDRVIGFGQSRDDRYLHLGGGQTSLRHFKSQIATGTVPYYVVRRVHDRRQYERLVGTTSSDEGLFPAYRERLLEP